MINVGILGGSGYTGGELIRLLSVRDDVEITQVTSNSNLGLNIHQVHPNLRGFSDMRFTSEDELGSFDVLFTCLPHGKVQSRMSDLLKRADKVIDLSADFRLNDQDLYTKWYGDRHRSPDLLGSFVYGLPELHRKELSESTRAAGPGCIATASILGLYPFREIAGRVIIDAKIGSSASGKESSPSTHHPVRNGVIRPYAPISHRHQAEILQETGREVSMTVHAVEMVRGISSTIHVELKEDLNERDVWKMLRDSYGNEPFIRIISGKKGLFRYPEPKLVAGTNFCDIGFELDNEGDRLVIFSAIDNLVKGAAGSAVQSMNIMMGIEETKGLRYPGLHPV
ncbi:MAG: N-acetyl-gamma-glutamyl-phosphate reductase [Thermoplasmatota archaeon]